MILAEGQERAVRLDDLNVQLAAAAAEDATVQRAFSARTGTISYAGSCRDSSVALPQDLIQVFAGVVARFVRDRWGAVEPFMGVWEWSDQSYSLSSHTLPACPPRVMSAGGWEVENRVAGRLTTEKVSSQAPSQWKPAACCSVTWTRAGAWYGSAWPCPLRTTSVEWPDMYIRGAEGLRERVNGLHTLSGGQLSYVGEWHSHPPGIAAEPSSTDRAAFAILRQSMHVEGLPTVMLIQGDGEEPGILVG